VPCFSQLIPAFHTHPRLHPKRLRRWLILRQAQDDIRIVPGRVTCRGFAGCFRRRGAPEGRERRRTQRPERTMRGGSVPGKPPARHPPNHQRSNATKPPRFLCSVSVSTRIRSASVLAALRRPLRRRTSSRCFSLDRARLAPFALRSIRISELLAARPSSLPSTCSHHKCTITRRARGAAPKSPLLHKNFHLSTAFRSIPRFPHARRGPRNATRPPRSPCAASIARESICACPRRFIVGQDGVELASMPRRLGTGELLACSPAFVASGVDGS
jgi:hypothetical protein